MHGLGGLINLRNEAPTIPVVIVSAEQDKQVVLQAITYGAALTRKQLLVLERMTKGESNKQIAYNLDIAETTVKAHVSAILRKLNVHNRVQAILSAGDIDFTAYLRR
uniref:HTH luxR-type domain-containing protein n=1 Tax=Steinernema glaseri TaxID=37863 RepID=A0A1I7Y012_9BILA